MRTRGYSLQRRPGMPCWLVRRRRFGNLVEFQSPEGTAWPMQDVCPGL